MRKLSILLVALLLAVLGQRLIANADELTRYIVRDGLLFMAIGAVIFAIYAGPLATQARTWGDARLLWPAWGRLLCTTGVACALASGVLFAVGQPGAALASLPWALWLAGLVLFIAGAWWPGGLGEYAPPVYRWQVDAAGKYVRLALEADESGESEIEDATAGRGLRIGDWFWLLLILALAAGLRLWRLTTLPADCMDAECVLGLRLLEGKGMTAAGVAPGLYDLAAQAIFWLVGDGLWSLRLASALLGIATVPAFYLLVRQYTRPGGALLGALLWALSPWLIWASRSSNPWVALPLLLCLACWALVRAYESLDRRWWAAAGVGLGALLYAGAPAICALAFWLLGALVLGLWAARRAQPPHGTAWLGVALSLGGMLAVSMPALARDFGATLAISQVTLPTDAASFVPSLLAGGALDIPYFATNALISSLVAPLSALGIGCLVRHVRQSRAALMVGGLLLLSVAVVLDVIVSPGQPDAWLAVAPFLFVAAAVALDQLLWAFQRTWAPVVQPVRMAAAIAAVLLVLAGRSALQLVQQLDAISPASQSTADVAMGRFVADCMNQVAGGPCSPEASTSPTLVVPASVLANAATRLLVGSDLDSERVRAFTLDAAPLHEPVAGDLIYLIPIDDRALLDALQQFYPAGSSQTEPHDGNNPPLFTMFRVSQLALDSREGLEGLYFRGAEYGQRDDAAFIQRDGPLLFDWSASPPLDAPFSVRWEGSLYAPVGGSYVFSIIGSSAGVTGPVDAAIFSLRLDKKIILDTSLGVLDTRQVLTQGFYRVEMSFRTDDAPLDWAVRWQLPGGTVEAIPRSVLYSPPLPDVGLIGAYFAGDQWVGPTLALRKDALVGKAVSLPRPYSVRWQGKLAAPRAGEYLLATLADGFNQVLVDGNLVVDYQPDADAISAPYYNDGSIYMQQGWHDIEVRYAPQGESPELRLLWQPPGSSPTPLLSRFLAPVTDEVEQADLPLPPAPDLVDANLGNEDFALAQSVEVRQSQATTPPMGLPPLWVEQVWQAGQGCGAGDGQFAAPRGVAMDIANQLVYVADTGNRRVVALRLDGERKGQYASELFQEPVDLSMGADGALMVLDAMAQQIYRLDPASGQVTPLTTDITFYHPRGLDVDPDGNLFVADTGGGRVAVLEAGGSLVTQYGGVDSLLGKGQPVDTLSANGVPWAVTAEDGRLWRLDNFGSVVVTPRGNTLNGPHLAGLPDGSFFLTDPVRHTILYLAASGQPLRQLAYPDAFVTPVGIGAAVADELVYLAVADSAACTVSLWRAPVDSLN